MELPDAGQIRSFERDYRLRLHEAWPRAPEGWKIRDGHLHRPISWTLRRERASERALIGRLNLGDENPTLKMDESIVRFPSAPVYTIHRKRAYQFPLAKRVNFHTLRLLRAPFEGEPSQIERVYLFNNGLNEIGDLTFYYRLAALLIARDQRSACIIRPFPAHLTRHPFPPDYAERPLDRYLLDSGDLFRQFVRYMLESQWLLSIVVPIEDYRVVAGLDLLASGKRHEPEALAAEIYDSWREARAATGAEAGGELIDRASATETVATLRMLLGWKGAAEDRGTAPASPQSLYPAVHTVGYSLGGFLAQALFFTWPFAISSCTTICSGGPLRDVSLTAFAHREEWEAVVNAVRYELSTSLIEGDIQQHDSIVQPGGRCIAGINTDYFSCFFRIFHDVFLQEDRGSYRSRVSEYIARLLFVVGGHDPIVPASSVLDASPPEGINLVEIANLTHFPEQGDREWQVFWQPEITGLLARFARRGEDVLLETLRRNWSVDDRTAHFGDRYSRTRSSRRSQVPELDPQTGDEALTSSVFQDELARVAKLLEPGNEHERGWIFIARNHVPTALLGPQVLHLRGTALHHSEELIWRYFDGLRAREELILDRQDRVTLIVPAVLREWFHGKSPVFSPKLEAAEFRVPREGRIRSMWRYFLEKWEATAALREFAPTEGIAAELDREPYRGFLDSVASELQLDEMLPTPLNTLPDVWIGFSRNALAEMAGSHIDRELVESALVRRAARFREYSALDRERRNLQGKGDFGGAKRLVEDMKRFAQGHVDAFNEFLETGEIRIVKVSAGDLNPRFMGWRVTNKRRARAYLIHVALGLTHSRATKR